MREKKKKVERENVEFRQRGYRISCAQFCCPGVRGVLEVKRKKNDKLIVAMPLPKQGNKKKKLAIVVMTLPKMGGGERGSEIYGRVKKKKGVMSTIFLQHFYNKSHVISYY